MRKLNCEGPFCDKGRHIWSFLTEDRITCEVISCEVLYLIDLIKEFSVIHLEGTFIPHLEQSFREHTTSTIPGRIGGVVRRGKVD